MDCEEDHTMTKSFVLIDKDVEKLIQMNDVDLSTKVSKFLATFNLILMSNIFIELTNFNFFILLILCRIKRYRVPQKIQNLLGLKHSK